MRTVHAVLALVLMAPVAFAQKPATISGSAIELRFVTLSDTSYEKLILANPTLAKGDENGVKKFILATPADLEKFTISMTAIRDVKILISPKRHVADGRKETISHGESKTFPIKSEQKLANEILAPVPNTETFFLGHTATVCPQWSLDRKKVALQISYSHTSCDSSATLYPVTTFVAPKLEIGAKGTPEPIAQFVARPPIDVFGMSANVGLTPESCVVMRAGALRETIRRDTSIEFLARVPYLNRLFVNESYSHESRNVLILATASHVEIPYAKVLVGDYRDALAEGRKDDAIALAMKALAADPACFAK